MVRGGLLLEGHEREQCARKKDASLREVRGSYRDDVAKRVQGSLLGEGRPVQNVRETSLFTVAFGKSKLRLEKKSRKARVGMRLMERVDFK